MPSRYHPASPFIIRLFLNLIEKIVYFYSVFLSNAKCTFLLCLQPKGYSSLFSMAFYDLLANTESWSKWPRNHGWEMTGHYSESTPHCAQGWASARLAQPSPTLGCLQTPTDSPAVKWQRTCGWHQRLRLHCGWKTPQLRSFCTISVEGLTLTSMWPFLDLFYS